MSGSTIKVASSSLSCRASLEWRYYFILISLIYESASLDSNLTLRSNIYQFVYLIWYVISFFMVVVSMNLMPDVILRRVG